MHYSQYVDLFVQNSNCFSYDHYLQGLRKLIRANVLNGSLGEVRQVSIDSKYINECPMSLFLGETNRMPARYGLIHDLLRDYEADKNFNFKKTGYFEKLFQPYQSKNIIGRYRGCQEIKRKTYRVIKIYKWLQHTRGDFGGVSCFISGNNEGVQNADYPICIKLGETDHLDNYVQLDGSHRRCVAAYLGYTQISSLVVSLDAIESFIEATKPAYFEAHSETFFNLISKIRAIV